VTEPPPQPDDHDDAVAQSDSSDERMAEVLRGTSTGADLRKKLQQEGTDEAEDLLSRLNALDFVQQVVGDQHDLPERIDTYEVKGLLGRGGMGTVYLGWQPELEREVALKVLSPTYTADPTMRKRFRAEARATAALHHRHIVPIYDYGEAQGMLFFAMERVDGMSLDKHISSTRRVGKTALEPLDAARRFAGVADALGLAHRRRLLHRDVKPGNILVAGDGTLALTDFGLAKALDHASMHLTSKGGGFLGTLHYASPEQALGAELTPASDLYSLGVTMFEAVTGSLPLSGKTTEALLQSILHGTPRRLRDFVPKPPRDFEVVLEKLLSREPSDRYQDGEALSRDLLRIADGEPVHIRRLPLHVRLWRRARKNPVLTGAFAAVFVLVMATLVLLGVLSREKGKGALSRHQNDLVAIAKDIGRELGPPWGPVPMLFALTGAEMPEVPVSANVLAALDRAHERMPDDVQVDAMRAAYVVDPAPTASALLREGRGYEALRLFDRAIAAAVPRRTGGDLAVEIGLYRLYLGRGVAKLTAAVARPNDAATDLTLASYLRPGAVFPKSLLDVLEVVQSADVQMAAERLERELERSSAERVRTVGLLLWAAARHRPHVGCNLMGFSLGFQKRHALHELAERLLGEELAECVGAEDPTGLAVLFADACRSALQQVGVPAVLRDLQEKIDRDVEASVHPESAVQAWRYVMQILRQPRHTGPLVDDARRQLPPALQLAVWRDLLSLSPSPDLVRLWMPRFENLRRNHPGLPGLVPVTARMHGIAGTDEAVRWATDWIAVAQGDPRAHLCRMRALLRAGRLDEARDDAIVAVQQSISPEDTVRAVLADCADASSGLDPAAIAAVRVMGQQFAALLDGGLPHFGGGGR